MVERDKRRWKRKSRGSFDSKKSLLVKREDEGKRRRERKYALDEVVGYNRL